MPRTRSKDDSSFLSFVSLMMDTFAGVIPIRPVCSSLNLSVTPFLTVAYSSSFDRMQCFSFRFFSFYILSCLLLMMDAMEMDAMDGTDGLDNAPTIAYQGS